MTTTPVAAAPLPFEGGAAGGPAEPDPRRPREAAPAGADAALLPIALLDSRFPQTVVALADGAQVAVRSLLPPPLGEGWGGGPRADTLAAVSPSPQPSPQRGDGENPHPNAPPAGEGGIGAVVLLHGIGSGAASWLHVALALGGNARVIAWDAPGYGDSTPLSSPAPGAIDYADRLHALLAALRIQSCVLVGHSLGALMAAAFAAGSGRDIVRRLVLVSPARGYGAPDKDGERQQVLDGRLQTLQRLGVAGMAAQSPDRMLSPAASAEARAWVRWNTARLNLAGYTQAVRMLCSDDILRYAGDALPMPVEVHGGDADAVVTPDLCRHVAAAFGAPFTPIAAAGHASPVEQPADVARRIAVALAASGAPTHAVNDRAAAIARTVGSRSAAAAAPAALAGDVPR